MTKVGVIGLGMGQGHLRGYSAQSDVQILGIADIDEKRLSASKAQYNVPNAFTDYHALLALPDLDAVSVCLPNYLHAPVAIEPSRASNFSTAFPMSWFPSPTSPTI